MVLLLLLAVTCKAKKDSFTDVTFTYDDVCKVIVNLKSKNSTGPDGFSSVLLNKCRTAYTHTLFQTHV